MIDLSIKNILFVSLFGIAFFSFYLTNRIYRHLEEHQLEKYVLLGKPSLIMNNSISSNLLFLRFIFKSEWKELNDHNLESLCKKVIASYLIFWSVFLLMFFV